MWFKCLLSHQVFSWVDFERTILSQVVPADQQESKIGRQVSRLKLSWTVQQNFNLNLRFNEKSVLYKVSSIYFDKLT